MSEIDEVVATHADLVWRIAVRLLGNAEDAKDCYQQTFLDAMRIRQQPVKSWRSVLCTIATRRAMDHLRQRYRHRKAYAPTEVEPYIEDPPDRRSLHEELREHIRAALATLPEQQAEAFWLRHIEQQSQDEIAKHLDIRPGHVRVLVHRAIQNLRRLLSPSFSGKPRGSETHEHK